MFPQLTYLPNVAADSCTLTTYLPDVISAQDKSTTLDAFPPATGPTLYAGTALMFGQCPKCTCAGSDADFGSPATSIETDTLSPAAVIVAVPFSPEPFNSRIWIVIVFAVLTSAVPADAPTAATTSAQQPAAATIRYDTCTTQPPASHCPPL